MVSLIYASKNPAPPCQRKPGREEVDKTGADTMACRELAGVPCLHSAVPAFVCVAEAHFISSLEEREREQGKPDGSDAAGHVASP